MKSKDKFTKKAKQEGYKARSAYKLLDIQRRYHILKKSDRVLDLGCWPGSWLQICSRYCKEVIGVDQKQTSVHRVTTYPLDIFDDRIFNFGLFDVILSDVAPHTSGIVEIDQYKSFELSTRAFAIAQKLLKQRGHFLVKIFQSEEASELLEMMKKHFAIVKVIKPQASKQKSKEIYFLGLGFRS